MKSFLYAYRIMTSVPAARRAAGGKSERIRKIRLFWLMEERSAGTSHIRRPLSAEWFHETPLWKKAGKIEKTAPGGGNMTKTEADFP
mgnify:CR=1 FL=1